MPSKLKSFAKKIYYKLFAPEETEVATKPVHVLDRERAWKFKEEFFWNAFMALDFNGIDGDYVEFGSHGAMTFRLAYDQIIKRKTIRHMWAFDSFRGLPESSDTRDEHPRWQKGEMSISLREFLELCDSHEIPRDKYTTVSGYYEETLRDLTLDDAPNNIALAYIDCDMYTSTKTVLDFLMPRLKTGMIIAFDDYFCWSNKLCSGERLAMLDSFEGSQKWTLLPYRDYGWAGKSFVVESSDRLHQ